MKQFKNIFSILSFNNCVNFDIIVRTRKAIMEKQGLPVQNINWDLYTKVLESKFERLKYD